MDGAAVQCRPWHTSALYCVKTCRVAPLAAFVFSTGPVKTGLPFPFGACRQSVKIEVSQIFIDSGQGFIPAGCMNHAEFPSTACCQFHDVHPLAPVSRNEITTHFSIHTPDFLKRCRQKIVSRFCALHANLGAALPYPVEHACGSWPLRCGDFQRWEALQHAVQPILQVKPPGS